MTPTIDELAGFEAVPGGRFHQYALDQHVAHLVNECRIAREVTDDVRVAVADAMVWAVRLREDVLNRDDGLPQAFRDGARWARNRIVHGNAHLLALTWTSDIERSFNSTDILWNDPEVSFNGTLATTSERTARFAAMDAVHGDRSPHLRPAYNKKIAGQRVVVVCGLLAGQRTLGRPFSGHRA